MRSPSLGIVLALSIVSVASAQQDDVIYKPGGDVTTPRLIKDVKPQYTPGAMRRQVNGTVYLQCVVDRDGVPTRVEITRSLDDELDRVSLDALKQWRFEPGRKDGQPVLVRVEVMMAFSTPTKKSRWKRIWPG